jgi:hypothetical protein
MAKMIEVDETEFQNSAKLRDTVAAILKNPSARRKMLEAQKEVFPDAPIPELDATKPVLEAVETVTKKFDEFTKKIEDERKKEIEERQTNERSAKWAAGQQRLRDRGVTEEGLKAVEDMMVKKGIADHDDAWIIFERTNPPATPAISSSGSGPWDFMGQPDEALDKNFKALIDSRGEDERALNNLVNSALNEVRGAAPARR